MDINKTRPDIDYPTEWQYKIIGLNIDDMLSAVEESIKGLEYKVSASNVSSNDKYFSLNVVLIVPSELIRDLIFQNLSKHPAIKFVI